MAYDGTHGLFASSLIFIEPYGSIVKETSTLGEVADLREHFQNRLPAPHAQTAVLALDTILDSAKIREWIHGVRHEVFNQMWVAGVRDRASFQELRLREYFLDKVLATRASKHGFRIRNDGRPHNLFTASNYFFVSKLAKGWFFIDWTGSNLSSGGDRAPHSVRGHALQVAYLAENVPNLVELIKYTGRTIDRYSVWSFLFDNAANTQTPFWSGFWVTSFSDYLGIRY